jgi:hypothetical protein
VVVRLNPSSPIILKSPYVLECAAICSGAIGALVDGSTHATGAKTMIFHGYTVISDNGIGYWVKDGGKAEIVSCFTYYCYFGYTSSGGGFIRALNGNNSYGTWGATSRGYDVSETPLTGTLLGQQLNFVYGGGTITAGNTITSATGSAIVTNVQYSSDKVYVRNITGTFSQGQTLTISGTTVGTVKAGALENQKGFVLVLNGLSSIPKTGSSISLAGDTYSYVIQSVSGTYVNTSSEIVLVLAQEKPTGSASGTAATIRTKYSQIRLTGHDFLSIGTGGTATTNYPGTPTQPSAQGNETDEVFPGRVFYVSTDQDGNFRVGEYFRIDQATGRATLNASAFDLAGLTSLRLGSIGAQLGETINEFSSDATLSGNSNLAVPTEYAVKTYVDSGTTTLTNKTINLTSNTLSGTRAQFNAALSDDDFATLSGTETLSNKTLVTPNLGTPSAINLANATNLPVASITASTTSALGVGSIELGHASDTTITRVSAGTIAVEGVNIVTTSSTNTLTNKTLTSPVISTIVNTGTLTLPTTTDTLVGRATTDTLTNKTLASPVITGTPTGITATHVGLGNVTNESKATMFSSPTFTGTVTGVTATHVGLGNVTNESKATMFSSPAFTGTPTTTTAGAGTNNTQIASTAYVVTEITNRSASASDFPYVVASNPTTFYYTTGAYISRQLVANASGAAITPTLVSGTLPTGTSLSGGYLQGTISGQGSFNFTVRFQSNYSITSYEFIANSAPVGQAIFTTAGVYSWTAPIGVTSVSVVAVGAGGIAGRVWASMGGGGGGGLGYRNNISVTPGTAYTVCVGCTVGNCPCPDYSTNPSCSGSSWFKDCSTVVGGGAGHGPFNGGLCCMLAGGGYVGDGGGYGGTSSNSWPCSVGAGAGGYGGCGGSSCFGDVNTYGNGMCGSGASGGCMYSSTYGLGGGGGTGVYGVGTPGCHNCDFNSQVAGCGGSYGGFFPNVTNAGSFNGMGGQGGSTCYGTGTPGHQGENPYAYCYNYVGSSYRGSGVFGGSACFYNVSNCYHMRSGGFPGGGGGAAGSTSNCSGYGGDGAVRIIWPGTSRSFPSTRTADE